MVWEWKVHLKNSEDVIILTVSFSKAFSLGKQGVERIFTLYWED